MIYKYWTVILLLLTSTIVIAQNNISITDIYTGQFSTNRLESLESLNNGTEYIVLNYNSDKTQSIDKYSYATGDKTGTLVSSTAINTPILDYTLSDDESQLLIISQQEPIYRHSSHDLVHVYNINTKQIKAVSDHPIRSATLSPDGSKVAYVYNNNIYYKDLTTDTTTQVTTDGVINELINGVTDWVYEEEFAFVQAYQWSPDSKQIAFLSFDEREVPEFSMDVYGAQLYPNQQVFKYPKAGENNARVDLHVYDLLSRKRNKINLNRNNEFYIPRIKYAPTGQLAVQVLNRHQNVLDFYLVDNTGKAHIAFTEQDDAYIEITDDLTFLDDGSFIWSSSKDNWNHLYYYDANGSQKRQITSGDWDVTAYYGYDRINKRIYYQSTEQGSINRSVYTISIKGNKKQQLSQQVGTNSADFSHDYSYYINTYSSATTPPIYTLHNTKNGQLVREIKNNKQLLDRLDNYIWSPKEYTTIGVNGNDLNMWMIKPVDFDPNKTYPLLMYQYSGPGSQQVANRWYSYNDYWHSMIANMGYIVVCIDGRGTGYKGSDFKKITQKQLGKYEVEDQITAARHLSKLNYIDSSRIGIWGWSYGGFMSSNCLLQGNDTFSMAVAVAPVTSWRFYDSIYTERYMTTPQENPTGYDDNSPLSHVDRLKGNYLLVHGSADDNVHVQNTMRMVEALVQANKQFDWAIYPDKNHGIYGGNTRIHLFEKITDFITENL